LQQSNDRASACQGERETGQTDQWLTDREIFLRGGGRLGYLSLTRRRQIAFIGLGAALAVWLLGTTVVTGYLALDRLAAQRESEEQKLEYISLLSDIGEYHQEFARIVGEFEGNQSLLLSHLAETAEPDGEGLGIDQIQDQLNDTRADKARMLIVRQALRSRLESFEEDLQKLAARDADQRERLSATLETLEQTRAEGTEVVAARALLGEELDRVESDLERLAGEKAALELTLAARENLLQSQIATLQSDLEAAQSWTETLQAQRDFHESRADKMETRLNDVSDIQSAVVSRLAKRTMAGIDMIERVVAMTGLNVNELIASMDIEGLALAQGGPYFDIAGDYLITDDPNLELQSSVFVLNQQMDRWEALQEVIRSIPLTSPLDHYRVSSGYGERTDPVNGRKAMHYGIDLKAPPKTPIMATAPGTVVFAGWRGEYGRVVEIDHGNGIRTRYAHLRKLLVKKGQEVAHRDEIALLGNSGRSTGAHVHYEILVEGQPKDPARFVMAGRNAFKD
jgi:murein DD-endopeptidase MepM/ murein hydrolase activator NlpD